MPFAYYGAKHGLARYYPHPRHRTVIEPFAGSAAYSVYHAAHIDRVILIDADPQLIELWHQLQTMTVHDVDLIGAQVDQERYTSPLLAGMAGSSSLAGTLAGKDRAVTPRIRETWPKIRARIIRALPYVARWEINYGSYADAPDIEATWFVDPPYQSSISTAGSDYRFGSIDYPTLADWCLTRRGFVLVCEQSPASWLPFHPFRNQQNGATANSSMRTELIYRNDLEPLTLFGRNAQQGTVGPSEAAG